jgi:hypothetical protein
VPDTNVMLVSVCACTLMAYARAKIADTVVSNGRAAISNTPW